MPLLNAGRWRRRRLMLLLLLLLLHLHHGGRGVVVRHVGSSVAYVSQR